MAYEDYDIVDQQLDPREAPQLDFSKYFKGMWERKWIILILMILTAVPFYYKAKSEIPVYKCQVTIQSKKFSNEGRRILNDVRQAEMRSRMFSERLASSLGEGFVLVDSVHQSLDNVFETYHTTKSPETGTYKVVVTEIGDYYLYKIDKDGKVLVDSAAVWSAVEEPRSVNGMTFRLTPEFVKLSNEATFKIIPFPQAVNNIENSLTARFSRTGNFMILEMVGTDPEVLPKKLNKVAQVYMDEALKLESRDVDNHRRMLRQRLEVAEEKMRKSEAALRNFYEKYPLSLDAEKQDLLQQMKQNDRYLELLPRQRQELTNYLEKLESVDEEDKDLRRLIVHQIARFPAMQDESELVIYRGRLENLEEKYADLYQRYSIDNPELQNIRAQIDSTQQQIISFASKYRNTLAAREAELKRRAEELQEKLRSLPDDEYRLMELERSKKIDEDLYTYLYTEMQKIIVSDTVEGETIGIIEPAEKPHSPINPGKETRALLGGGLGLLLGLLLSVTIDALDRSIYTVKDVEKTLGLNILGKIPFVAFQDIPEYSDYEKAKRIDNQLVTHDYSPTAIGESYRALRTHLMFSKETGRIRSLLITSTKPEEGKSFTASNLAIIMAQQRSYTLLVDADLRRGVQHNTFGCKKTPGLTNYLSNSATLSSIVQPTHIPNLSTISCGSMIPNPSELLGSRQMERFLLEAGRKFDFIIFDAPPLEAATDSVVLGTQVDAVSIVVRAGDTNKKEAKEKLEVFKNVPANVIGVIINGTEEERVKKYYSYYHY